MFEGVKKILVIKLRHIGDVLLTVPAIRALSDSFPGASITALVNSGTEEMLTLNPLLSRVIAFDRSVNKGAARLGRDLGFIRELRKERFDMTVDLTGGDRPAIIGRLTGARYRLGYDPKGKGFAGKRLLYTHLAQRPRVRTHTVLRDLGVLNSFGISTKDLSVRIYTSPDDDAFVNALLEGAGVKEGSFVHVHPTSRWLFKCWSDRGMAQVMDWLQASGLRVVITSGPEPREIEKIRSIIGLMETTPVDFSGRLKLKHLASLSRKAAFFFGVDSAPMHIAAASNTRTVGVFGPSGAFDWGPWDNSAWSGGAPGHDINSPYGAQSGIQSSGGNLVIQMGLDCVPCGRDGCNGSKRSECLEKMGPEFVMEALCSAGLVKRG